MDNFKFQLVGGMESPFLGYVSSIDPTAASPRISIRGSTNMYKKLSGTWANRPGLARRGSADATLAGTKSSTEWESSIGVTRVLRVNNGKLQVESDIVTPGTLVWYDLMTGLTLTRFVFRPWWNNTLKKDELIMVKGDSNLHMWQGGIGVVSSTTANTIVLTTSVASQGFDTASGSVRVNGTVYGYTGTSGNNFTGVTPDPTGEANGSAVFSEVVTTANPSSGSNGFATFLNDFINIIGNRLHVGSYTSRLTYISDDSDYTNFTVPATRAPGDPEILTLDNLGRGIAASQGKALISAGTSDWYVISYIPITVGSTLTEQTIVDKKPVANLQAALAHEFIDNVGDDVVYIDQNNQLRMFGTFKNLNTRQYPSLSLPLKAELENEDFTGGHIRTVNDLIYIVAPISGKDYMHETRQVVSPSGEITSERFWHTPQIRNLSRIAVIGGIEYGHSNANPQIYRLWDTRQWHDDSPTDEPLPYDSRLRMSYRHGARASDLLVFDKIFYEGYMTPGSDLTARVAYDYQGASGLVETTVNSISDAATFYFANSSISLGDSSLGDNPLGDGVTLNFDDQDLLPKFRAIPLLNEINCFEFQIDIYSSEIDSRWEILRFGPNGIKSQQNPTFLTK